MKIVLLADIHIGAIKDCNYVYNVITEIVDKEIGSEPCNVLILLGDYFDRLFKLNEEYVGLAVNVMSYIVRKCIQNHTKIRIVYGTESHEMGQYKIFNHHLTSSRVDMKLIDTCTSEELFPGVNVLYLPEEYMNSKSEFYKDTLFSGKRYEYIFGHGMIMDGMPDEIALSKTVESEKQVPRFVSKDFESTGAIVSFGHYHQHVDITPNVHYVGSLFRWKFGEDTPKGYAVIRDGKWEFVENPYAYQFITYQYEKDNSIFESAENLLKEINQVKQKNAEILTGDKYGKVRLIFYVPENVFSGFRDTLKGALVDEKQISVAVKDTKLIEEIEKDSDTDEYDYILDESMDIPTKIHHFMHQFFDDAFTDDELNPDKIRKYIKEDLDLND